MSELHIITLITFGVSAFVLWVVEWWAHALWTTDKRTHDFGDSMIYRATVCALLAAGTLLAAAFIVAVVVFASLAGVMPPQSVLGLDHLWFILICDGILLVWYVLYMAYKFAQADDPRIKWVVNPDGTAQDKQTFE